MVQFLERIVFPASSALAFLDLIDDQVLDSQQFCTLKAKANALTSPILEEMLDVDWHVRLDLTWMLHKGQTYHTCLLTDVVAELRHNEGPILSCRLGPLCRHVVVGLRQRFEELRNRGHITCAKAQGGIN